MGTMFKGKSKNKKVYSDQSQLAKKPYGLRDTSFVLLFNPEPASRNP
jgi:hypothetical protein